jgi:hypothetical protein
MGELNASLPESIDALVPGSGKGRVTPPPFRVGKSGITLT